MTISRFWTVATPEVQINNPGAPGGGGGGGSVRPKGNNAGNKQGKGRGAKGGGAGWTGRGNLTAMFMQSRNNVPNEQFTAMPLYWGRYAKPTGSGTANADIVSWSTKTGTTAGQTDFDATTGVWTCSIAGWYLHEAYGYNAAASNNYQIHAYIDRAGGGFVLEPFMRGIHYQSTSPPGSWKGSAPMAHIRHFAVGDKVKLYQWGGVFQEGVWSVIGLYSSGGFYAQKTTGTGSRTAFHVVDGYDSATTFGNGFTFSTSTGIATITRAGRWVIGGKGFDIAYSPTTETPHGVVSVNGSSIDMGSLAGKGGINNITTNGIVRHVVADLANGDQVNLLDRGAMGDCEFYMFKIHDDAHWFRAWDLASAAAGAGYYTGWSDSAESGVTFNKTTGLATTARAGVWNLFAGAYESPATVNNNVNYEFRVPTLVGDQWYNVQDSIASGYPRQITNSGILVASVASAATMGFYNNIVGNTPQSGTFSGWEVRGNDS